MPEEKHVSRSDLAPQLLPSPLLQRTRKRWSANEPARPGLLLGWPLEVKARKFGFAATTQGTEELEPLGDGSDAHLITVAPTGAGKGVSNLIPVLGTYPGTIIVVDLKGEAAQVTARRRREWGHQVVVLDPFGVVEPKTAACAAALAGCGQGKDADHLDAQERARLRQKALNWLQADLTAWRNLFEKSQDKLPETRTGLLTLGAWSTSLEKYRVKTTPVVGQKMQHWLSDADFNGVRGAEALAKLPEPERAAWQRLWWKVTALRRQAQP